jgi:hypothetical protein
MKTISGRTYSDGETIDTDGQTFNECQFQKVSLRYGGGLHPVFNNCGFGEVGWIFTAGALRTIQFLQQINASPGGPGFVADLFTPGKYFADE